MKTRIIYALMFVLVSVTAWAQDPAVSGINPAKSPIAINETTTIEADVINGSSAPIPQANNATWTINLPPNIEVNGPLTFDDPTVTAFLSVYVGAYDPIEGTTIQIISDKGPFPGSTNGGAYTATIPVIGRILTPAGGPAAPMSINAVTEPAVGSNNSGNDNASSSISVVGIIAPPVASNDNGSTTGTPVILTVLTNDTPGSAPIDPTKVMLIDPNTNTPSTNVNIPGEGTYVVNTTTGEVTFTPDPAVTTPITSTIQYTITDNNNLTSVPATITINVTPLPVTLVSFTAKKEGAVALLNWATTEETNSDRFEIQHSVSGKDWVNVGEVTSSGESKVLKNYTFSHTKPVHGQNLYRLKMIDKDMTFAYSRIQGVSFEGIAAADLSVYPNPSTDKLFIRDNGTVKEVVINNLNGNAVYRASSSFAAGDGLIDVTTLPQGMYIVKVTRQNGLVSTSKVVINK